MFRIQIKVVVRLAILLGTAWTVGGALAGAQSFEPAILLGGGGDQRATGTAAQGGQLTVVGADTPQAKGLLSQFNSLPPGTEAFSRLQAPGNTSFAGVARVGSEIFAVGSARPPSCGATDSVGGVEGKTVLARYDSVSGFVSCQSTNVYGYSGGEQYTAATGVFLAGGGVIFTTGNGENCGFGYNVFFLDKYTVPGSLAARATEQGSTSCVGFSGGRGIVFLDGYVYVAGHSGLNGLGEDGGRGTGTTRPVLMKYDAGLTRIWKQRPGESAGFFNAVTAMGGSLYAVGNTYVSAGTGWDPNPVAGSADYLIEKYGVDGTRQWRQVWGGGDDDVLTGVVAIGSRLFAVGHTKSTGAGGADAVVFEIDPADGSRLQEQLWGGAQDDMLNAAATDGLDLYAAGETRSYASAEGNVIGQNEVVILRLVVRSSESVPSADAGVDQLLVAVPPAGATASLDGSASTDPEGDPLTYTWTGPFTENGGIAWGVNPTVTLPVGSHTITLTVSDGALTATDTMTVVVENPACGYAIDPTSVSSPPEGTTGTIAVTTESWCGWTAVSNDPSWLTVTSGSPGSGSGTVGYSVAVNSGQARTATITIAGETFTVNQGGVFTDIGAALVGVRNGSAAWGDYDNDGDLDILITGHSGSTWVARVYRNDGGGTFAEDTRTGLHDGVGVTDGSAEWGDYDNDGDLDIVLAGQGGGGPGYVARVYRNDGGVFTDIGAGLTGVHYGSVAWGDYDNDGDLDILLTGDTGSEYTAKVYRNDGGGVFADIGAGLPGVTRSSVAWGDYDNDGDLDILLAGLTISGYTTSVYRNDGSGVFADIGAGLTGVNFGRVAWGDLDNDGDLDILVAGGTGGNSGVAKLYRNDGGDVFTDVAADLAAVWEGAAAAWGDYDNDGDLDVLVAGYLGPDVVAKLYRNDGGDALTDIGAGLTGVGYSSVAWGDYDNDGDLDILLTGWIGSGWTSSSFVTKVYRNDTVIANTPPNAPGSLVASPGVGEVVLAWTAPSDAQTPAAGLTCNLRVGTSPGAGDVMPPMAAGSGYRRIPAMGNAQHGMTALLKALPPGTYYWSVQAIDSAFAGSAFPEEQSFEYCLSSLDPPAVSPPPEGASGTVSVTTDGWCSWAAVSHAPWITVTGGASGTGSGTVSYTVDPNPGGARSGTIAIASQTFTVNQAELQSLSIDNTTVSEGGSGTVPANFTVTLSAASSQTVTVQYTTLDGEAAAPADYTAVSGDLTFVPGDVSEPITVLVQGDLLDEADERFTVQLSLPVNALIAQGLGTGTIIDDDPTPSLSIDDVSVIEGNSGTTLATFTVTLSAPSGRQACMAFTTQDQSAQAPGDYTSTSGTVCFAPGETTKTISVEVVGDTEDEDNETFLVTLSDATNAVIGDGEGIGTILDDENALMQPAALTLTPLSQGVLKSGDTVEVQPSWRNDGSGATADMTGSATASNGGTLVDGAASYGVVGIGATASCAGESDCYSLTASGPRPASHWDVKLTETLSENASHEWLLHVGDSFSDVPRSSSYFRFIETLYHHSVTGGCTATTYCPGNSTTRAQMSIFALVGKEGSSYAPVACGATPMFTDVAVTSPYCKWVEELARRGVVGGCGGGNYCPNNAVTRGQMAIFMLKTLDPALDPPACTTPMFGDVQATSPYCKWVEELARRGVVGGCGGGNYCPSNPVTRAQMGVFISATFGLTLYGP